MAKMKVVRGKKIRVTRVDRCGMPLAGPGNQLVTEGFVTVNFTQQMKDAEDLEQANANGDVCVSDRTTPQVKWGNVDISLCDVDTELLGMMTGMPQVLDHNQDSVGFRISDSVQVDGGFALELWTGTAGDGCDEPDNDDIFSAVNPIQEYGYWLAPAVVEGVIGDVEVGASVSTFNVTGRAVAGPRWGRGPYNVVGIDDDNTAGRLLQPMGRGQFVHVQKTTIGPPESTSGAAELTVPMPYYGAEGVDSVEELEDAGVPEDAGVAA